MRLRDWLFCWRIGACGVFMTNEEFADFQTLANNRYLRKTAAPPVTEREEESNG
jgi:hypothetical protein